MSYSSRGSRITTNLAAFFQPPVRDANAEAAEEQMMAERAEQQALQQQALARGEGSMGGYTPGGYQGTDSQVSEGQGFAPPEVASPAEAPAERNAVATEPASGLMRPATNKLVRVDSDGFEIDDDEDQIPTDNRALAQQVVTAVSGTPRHEDAYDEGAPVATHKRNMSTGGVVTSMRPAAMRSSAAPSSGGGAQRGAADRYAGQTPSGEPSGEPSSVMGPQGGMSASPKPADSPQRMAPAPARRSTGKTGFIRDWLGSAEPAPGEGPSIALFTGRDSSDDNALRDGLATGSYRRGGAAPPGLATVADEDVQNDDVGTSPQNQTQRRELVKELSRSTHSDLRTVLEKSRIQAESDQYNQEVEERESQHALSRDGRSGAAAPAVERSAVTSNRSRPHAENSAATPDTYMPAGPTNGRAGYSGTNGAAAMGEDSGAVPPSAPLPQSDVAAMDVMRSKASPPPSETSRSAKVCLQATCHAASHHHITRCRP